MGKATIVFLHGLTGSKHYFEYLKKEFSDYQTISFDLIGFGDEAKPKISYDIDDFMQFLDLKLQLFKDDGVRYILVGHSLGALLAKEAAKRYPHKIEQIFLLGYPFLGKDKLFGNMKVFDEFYVNGAWWTKVMCEMRTLFKVLFLPVIFLFRYKYRKTYLGYFKHTYQSVYGTIHNVILKDNKEDLFKLPAKIIFINGQKDKTADLKFAGHFKQYLIESMGHLFFNHESEIAKIIKNEIDLNNNFLLI